MCGTTSKLLFQMFFGPQCDETQEGMLISIH